MAKGHLSGVSVQPLALNHTDQLEARQEKLLLGLMREIVRMAGRKESLDIGVNLFPVSHDTLFCRDGIRTSTPGDASQTMSGGVTDNTASSMSSPVGQDHVWPQGNSPAEFV